MKRLLLQPGSENISVYKKSTTETVVLFGRGREIRTPDTQFWRLLLYQLNYTPIATGGPSGTRTRDQPVMSRSL